MVISSVFWVMVLGISVPPTIEPGTFGDSDPIAFRSSDSYGKGVINARSFSGALSRAGLASCIAELPIPDHARQSLVACAIEIYPSYLTAHGDVVKRRAGKYLGICRELAEQLSKTGLMPSIEQIRDQVHEADAIQRELMAVERTFIDSLQECIDNAISGANPSDGSSGNIAGAVVLESMALRAGRRYSDVSISPRGADLDLRSLVNQLGLGLPTRRIIEADLLAYERALATLKPAQCKAYWECPLRMRALIDRLEAKTLDYASFTSQSKRISALSPRIGAQIRDEAIATIARIAPQLPSAQRQLFERMVHKEIFPEIDNDPTGDALRAMFAAALTGPGMSLDQSERLKTFCDSWTLELNVWQSKAEATLLEWSDREAAGEKEYFQDSFKPMLAELLQKREDQHAYWSAILDAEISSIANH